MACNNFLTPVQDADATGTPVLRHACAEDLVSLIDLDRRCFGQRAWPVRGWWGIVTEPGWTTQVMAVEGKMVAASVLLLWRPTASLASIAVDPAWRNRGLGSTLLHDAVGRARAASARYLTLEVDLANRDARRLYAREGFGLIRRFREGAVWRVELLRRLSSPR